MSRFQASPPYMPAAMGDEGVTDGDGPADVTHAIKRDVTRQSLDNRTFNDERDRRQRIYRDRTIDRACEVVGEITKSLGQPAEWVQQRVKGVCLFFIKKCARVQRES